MDRKEREEKVCKMKNLGKDPHEEQGRQTDRIRTLIPEKQIPHNELDLPQR